MPLQKINKSIYIPFGHAKKLSDLDQFLPFKLVDSLEPCTHVAGWGYKPSGIKAKKLALRKNKKYILMEDGFIAKIPFLKKDCLISMVLDTKAPYFDTSVITDLEQILIQKDPLKLPSEASDLLQRWRSLKPKKYSSFIKQTACFDSVNLKNCVVIIDQIKGDAALDERITGKAPFQKILEFISSNYPEKTVLIKPHPRKGEGFFNKKESAVGDYLKKYPQLKIEVLPPHFELDVIKENIQEVLVVNSLMGFELLLNNYKVRTFGSPWYAGWGLTSDEYLCERKLNSKKDLSLEFLFYCTYALYNVYVHPVTRKRCSFEDILDHIELQKNIINEFPKKIAILNAQKWKKPYYDKFLQFCDLRYISEKELNTLTPDEGLVSWGQRFNQSYLDYLRKKGFKVYQCEDGFLRSFGLGCELTQPFSLSFDDKGLYANPKLESKLNDLVTKPLNTKEFKESQLFIRLFKSLRLTKYLSVGQELSPPLLDFLVKNKDKKVMLVCGQVADDVSFLNSGFSQLTFQSLISTIKVENPDSLVIYRPHPDCFKGIRQGEVFLEEADYVDIESNIASLLDISEEIHVVNSLTGVEALLMGKKVVCWGNSWYCGRGLTVDKGSEIQSKTAVSLEQLVHGAYIKNPIYFDYNSNQYTSVFNLLEILKNPKNKNFNLIGESLKFVPYALKDKVSYVIHLLLGRI